MECNFVMQRVKIRQWNTFYCGLPAEKMGESGPYTRWKGAIKLL